jgi:tetratricopeptide (TPR) repeat protein
MRPGPCVLLLPIVLALAAVAPPATPASTQETAVMADLDTLWNFDDPAGTEVRFRALLPELAPGSPARCELLTQVARTQGLQRAFAAADSTLDEVEAALAGPAATDRVRIRYLLERGRVRNSAGDPSAARPLFIEAFDRALLAKEDALAVDAAHMVAIVEAAPADQARWNERALALAAGSTDPKARQWRGSLLNNMGWTRHGEKDYAAALDLFEQALAARLEQGDAGSIRVARWCVARCLRSLGRLDEALARQRELEAECTAAGAPDGYVYEEIGECLLALGRAGEARPALARAYEELSKDPWLAANEQPRLERLRALAEGRPAPGD